MHLSPLTREFRGCILFGLAKVREKYIMDTWNYLMAKQRT